MWLVPFLSGILVATSFGILVYLFYHFEEVVHNFRTSIQNFNWFGLRQNSGNLINISTFIRMVSTPYGLRQNSRNLISISTLSSMVSSLYGQLKTPNVAFYENKIPAKPNKEYIEEILIKWPGNYTLLQNNATYIQWLFPNRTPGTNGDAHALTDKEVKIFQETPELRNRVKKSFQMMLDFYGMKLTQENQIQLKEGSNKRLKVLNKMNNHNFLCITRILLSLKELGHCKLMRPWMECLADLIYSKNRLHHAKFSFEWFWINTLDAKDQLYITNLIKNYSVQRT